MTDTARHVRGRLLNRLIWQLALLSLSSAAALGAGLYRLPPERCITWQDHVGVRGDIPQRRVVYTVLTPGHQDGPALQEAIDRCPEGQVVQLSAGTFQLAVPVRVKSGITVRGAGMGVTTLKGRPELRAPYLIGFDARPFEDTSFGIAGGLHKGSSQLRTGLPTRWQRGDLILIDQLNDSTQSPPVTNLGTDGACTWCGRANGSRAMGQLAEVTSVRERAVDVELPLVWGLERHRVPQATRLKGITSRAGIEDLTVDNSLSGSAAQKNDGASIVFYGTTNCWLLRVEAIGSYVNLVRMKRSYRDTIRGCKMHEGVPALPANGPQYGTSRAYGLVMDFASADLIENNQFYHLTMATLMRGPTSGNVVAYNYVTEMYFSSDSWQTDSFVFHGGHAMMNLFEGNYVAQGRMCADAVWGSSSHNTFFRNRSTLDPKRASAAWNYSLYRHATYFNFIGNVVGTKGVATHYLMSRHKPEEPSLFWLEEKPLATVLLHGNWDSAEDRVRWHGSNERRLPASLYLKRRPDWWGALPWPAIGPDLVPMYPAAPAIGTGTPWQSVSSRYGATREASRPQQSLTRVDW